MRFSAEGDSTDPESLGNKSTTTSKSGIVRLSAIRLTMDRGKNLFRMTNRVDSDSLLQHLYDGLLNGVAFVSVEICSEFS